MCISIAIITYMSQINSFSQYVELLNMNPFSVQRLSSFPYHMQTTADENCIFI